MELALMKRDTNHAGRRKGISPGVRDAGRFLDLEAE
jgi:hypothetical protein